MTYRECVPTLAPTLISFSCSFVSDQCFTDGGSAKRRPKGLRRSIGHLLCIFSMASANALPIWAMILALPR